jgi:hypothetical protein
MIIIIISHLGTCSVQSFISTHSLRFDLKSPQPPHNINKPVMIYVDCLRLVHVEGPPGRAACHLRDSTTSTPPAQLHGTAGPCLLKFWKYPGLGTWGSIGQNVFCQQNAWSFCIYAISAWSRYRESIEEKLSPGGVCLN